MATHKQSIAERIRELRVEADGATEDSLEFARKAQRLRKEIGELQAMFDAGQREVSVFTSRAGRAALRAQGKGSDA